MHGGRRRRTARLLAPLALLLAVAAVLVVVQSTTNSGDSKSDTASESSSPQDTTSETTAKPRPVRANYTVKLNDTLGLISEKTGVSVERLQTLNPDLDPQRMRFISRSARPRPRSRWSRWRTRPPAFFRARRLERPARRARRGCWA